MPDRATMIPVDPGRWGRGGTPRKGFVRRILGRLFPDDRGRVGVVVARRRKAPCEVIQVPARRLGPGIADVVCAVWWKEQPTRKVHAFRRDNLVSGHRSLCGLAVFTTGMETGPLNFVTCLSCQDRCGLRG